MRTASVHREPASGGYRDVAELPRDAILRPRADGLAALSVPLAALG